MNKPKIRSRKLLNKVRSEWSKNYAFCQECFLDEYAHEGKGLCYRCYSRSRYVKRPRRHKSKEEIAEYMKGYYDKNRDQLKRNMKAYYEKRKFYLNKMAWIRQLSKKIDKL